jgi:hypothetical protein
MSRVDRYPLPSEQEFEMLAERYIVVPGALWGAAMLVAVVAALVQPPAAPAMTAKPVPESAVSILAA